MRGAEMGRVLFGAFSFDFGKRVLTRGRPGSGPILAWAEPSPARRRENVLKVGAGPGGSDCPRDVSSQVFKSGLGDSGCS